MFVCLSVCLSVNFFPTTCVRILKFGTKLDSDELHCVTKNSHILLISPYICSFFFLSNGNFCQISQLPLEPVFLNFVYTFR